MYRLLLCYTECVPLIGYNFIHFAILCTFLFFCFFRRGDKLIQINGLDLQDLTPEEFTDILAEGSPQLVGWLIPYMEPLPLILRGKTVTSVAQTHTNR